MTTRLPSLQSYARLLGRYLRPLRRRALGMAGLILAGIALQLGLPLLMRAFIDGVQAGAALAALLRLGGVYLGLALAQQVVSVAATYVSETVGWSATNDLRADLAAHLLGLDLSFHNAHSPGELIERIDGDVTALSNFFSRFMVNVVGNLLLLLGIIGLLFGVDWRVGGVIAAFTGLTLLLMLRFRNLATPHWQAERQASAELFGFLEERLAGVEDVRANGGKGYVMNRFYRLMRELLRRSLRAGLAVNVSLNTTLFMFAVGIASAFAVGAYLYQGGVVSLGTVYIIFQYTVMLQRPLEDISRQMQDFQKAAAGLARVSELMEVKSKLSAPLPTGPSPHPISSQGSGGGARPERSAALAVEFDQVTFAYPDGPADSGEPVLSELSFRLEAGQTLGLLGRTGSGKTTLTRLLFRLYDPQRGAVRLEANGERLDLRALPLPALRRQVGMIPQNVQLFNASVRDNLTFFNPAISDERIRAALEDLGLGAWYAGLPAGLDTRLESGGGGLSAGQAQLLAFARIFLRDPGLVILDEASSRLDPASEAHIEAAIDRLRQGRTAVIVAHRLGTVQRADQIMTLEQGRIIEFGPRAALAADPGSHFRRLLETGLEEALV